MPEDLSDRWMYHKKHSPKACLNLTAKTLADLRSDGWCENSVDAAKFLKPTPKPAPKPEPYKSIRKSRYRKK